MPSPAFDCPPAFDCLICRWTGLIDETRALFLAGDDDAYVKGHIYFGLHGMHSPNYNRWIPAKDRGDVIFDAAFDLSDGAAQAAFKQCCADLRAATCEADVCARPPGGLLASIGTVECWLEDFEAQRGAAPGAAPLAGLSSSDFRDEVRAWLQTVEGRVHRRNVGVVDGELRFSRIRFVYTALLGIPVKDQRALYDASVGFLRRQYEPTAPPTLGRAVVDSGRLFSWMVTSEQLITVIVNGFAIIFPCAFVILLLSNGSFLAAACATVTVALITGSLLGGCKVAFGFALGIGEAIAGNIVIGLSVDYTLHLSHTYSDSNAPTREGKVQHAATIMGVTVLAGAATTFCSSLFMLPCQLTFFTDMCTLIGGTVLFSLLFALLFFMPLMALVGPEGHGCHDLLRALRADQAAIAAPEASVASTTSAHSSSA